MDCYLLAQTPAMEPRDWISLAVQMPLVAMFAWFVLRLSREYKADMKEQMSAFVTFISAQNQRLDLLSTAEAERRREAMQIGLQEIKHLGDSMEASMKAIADSVDRNNKLFVDHDADERSRWDTLTKHILCVHLPPSEHKTA